MSSGHETNESSLLKTATNIFGDGFNITSSAGGRSVDEKRLAAYYKTGGPHTTTGIPYQIHGSARVVQADVTEWLAGYVDPIKAILGTAVQNSQKVIITRKYVVGGGAIITPEHAPARSVAVQEDTREVRLTRYGGDVEMNLNLFLIPDEAKREFDMKIGAQRRELERTFTEIAYQTVMAESIPIQVALNRANPGMKNSSLMAEKIYINSVFGAMAKHPFPVANLLAAARHANMYTPPSGDGKHSVMLVPPGMLDIAHYTRPDSMKYSISGFKQSDNSTLSLDMPGVYLEPQLGVKILVSKRMPTYEHGTAFPQSFGEGYLNEEASWATYYTIPENPGEYEYGIVDFNTGSIETTTKGSWYRPCMRAMMGSVILCANPGSSTGEMLFAYPSTSLSSDKEIETLKCQLRVYMGCAIYHPENILRLPHVSFESIMAGGGRGDLVQIKAPTGTGHFRSDIRKPNNTEFPDNELQKRDPEYEPDLHPAWDTTRVYEGAVYRRALKTTGGVALKTGSAGWELFTKNTGHLGVLDDPEQCDRLHGMHKFSAAPVRV